MFVSIGNCIGGEGGGGDRRSGQGGVTSVLRSPVGGLVQFTEG